MNDIIFITHHLSGVGGVQKFIEILSEQFLKDGRKVTVIGMSLQSKDTHYEAIHASNENYHEVILYQDDIFLRRPNKLFIDSYITHKSAKKIQEIVDASVEPNVIISNPLAFFFLKNVDFSNANVTIGQMHNSADYLFESGGMYKLYLHFIKKHYRELDKFLMLTETDAIKVENKLGYGNLDFVANPLPFAIDESEKSRLEKKLVMLGRLDKIKQVDQAIEIVSEIFEEYPDWTFDIYGTGDLLDSLQKSIDDFQMSDRIKLKGFTKDITRIYQEASITLLTSEKEGLPMSIMESMAYGVPVIAYNCSPGVAELIGDAGILVDLNDKDTFKLELMKLMTDRTLLLDLSTRSFNDIKKYAPQTIAKKWYGFFNENV